MKTLTITEAKKNLGKWVGAAARGEEVAILVGEHVVALRKVEVEANDYARREYGVTGEELEKFEKRVTMEVARLRRAGGLISVPDNVEDALEKIAGLGPVRAKTAARVARSRKGRRRARSA